jgi:hypothetical protein
MGFIKEAVFMHQTTISSLNQETGIGLKVKLIKEKLDIRPKRMRIQLLNKSIKNLFSNELIMNLF